MTKKVSRRGFIKQGSCAAVTGIGVASSIVDLGIFARMAAAQETNDDFKVLVMAFKRGGADSNNIAIRLDERGYNSYAALRPPGLSVARPNIIPLNYTDSSGVPIGINGAFGELATLINQGKGALVLNVGPTKNPLESPGSARRDSGIANLFSHNDQEFLWQTSSSSGTARGGVLGRSLDIMRSFNTGAKFATGVSMAGQTIALVGRRTKPFVLEGDLPNFGATGTSDEEISRIAALQSGNILERSYVDLYKSSFGVDEVVDDVQGLDVSTLIKGNNAWDQQFKRCLKLIHAAKTGALGNMRRVCLFVADTGWDTHKDQNPTFDQLGRYFSLAIMRFYAALQEIGADQNTTIFTASDFGRTGNASEDRGTDHGWGGHYFVIGGGTRPGVYGQAPLLELNGPQVIDKRVRMMPQFSCDQYYATLGRWFGIPSGEMNSVFLHLRNFSQTDLGFMV